ncbi:hypothetical protein BCR39DRAFT_524096 [Naematelia encephala]|uniref:BHLH domain-containing protein n=1 Tax=Naematelia encephala TaxID=71784 RepID=A0A1Y2BB72_9TREE|nr:hypothetical protein BCR39DRAFT_524096 [Naematelia encephala]
MATPRSALPSPAPAIGGQDMSNVDFLSFMGLDAAQSDSTSPTQVPTPSQFPTFETASMSNGNQQEAGPSSNYASSARGSSAGSRRGSTSLDGGQIQRTRSNSGRSRLRGRTIKQAAGREPSARNQPGDTMEVDHSIQHQESFSNMTGFEDLTDLEGFGSGEGFDAMQAGTLQQQLEAIHMQSPLLFGDPNNPLSSYNSMAQMYLTSPPVQQQQMQGSEDMNRLDAHQNTTNDNGLREKWNALASSAAARGVLTPAPSGDMFPHYRSDMMSPMELEMLARAEGLESNTDFHNMLPLLSPALSQPANSTFTSPAFPSDQMNAASGQLVGSNQSPLEQLQEQQRQFQEQLQVLQEQQRQLQYTAAAVAAASTHTSPYISSNGQIRPATTPGTNGHHSVGATPSPGYFSPLTSPALEASSRAAHFNHRHSYSPAVNHGQRPPHPYSSPALNPIGSSGGANQTLSPALEPQNRTDMADPDYLRALVGYLDGTTQTDPTQQTYASPSVNAANSISSPATGPSIGAGPHRHPLPSKTRPSPMMKPTHRSHTRQPSANTSLPNSPVNVMGKYSQPVIPGSGFLPPAVIDHRGVQQAMQQNLSTSSTPSPVDLSQIMPPPPVPLQQNGQTKGIVPMTPASLMNLVGGSASAPLTGIPDRENNSTPVQAPRRQSTVKPAPAKQKVTAPVGKRQTSKLVPTAAGKRALAMRPPGVGVRSALKAAAAAQLLPLPEGETRKTSHKAAEQKRRDSLKAGFDELRLLLPPINTEALDPESGEPIPGSSAPRLLPKSSLVPDDNPNRGVSKVALLRFSNEYIVRLHDKIDKRDGYIDKLRSEVVRLRGLGDPDEVDSEIKGDEGEDLLEMDMLDGEEEDFMGVEDEEENDDEDMELGEYEDEGPGKRARAKSLSGNGVKKSPALGPTVGRSKPIIARNGSSGTVTGSRRRSGLAEE